LIIKIGEIMRPTFEITCDENGQFYVNDKPVDKRGFGWRQAASGRWYYSKEQNVYERLIAAIEDGNITKQEIENCKSYEERKILWEKVKAKKGIGPSHSHLIYLV
jgi:hypothetical protein